MKPLPASSSDLLVYNHVKPPVVEWRLAERIWCRFLALHFCMLVKSRAA